MPKHTSCPECGSSDAAYTYENGLYCFSCGYKEKGVNNKMGVPAPASNLSQLTPIAPNFKALTDRGIDATAAAAYKIGFFANVEKHGKLHCYPYFDSNGIHIANKVRMVDKKFFWEGRHNESTLFGQNLFPAGGKAITIVEGECDAAAAYQMTGCRYAFVSVKNGADGAVKDCTDQYEYLNSFEKIVICFDKDSAKINEKTGAVRYPGQEAAQAVAALFPIGKVHILTLREGKDPNEYLKNNLSSQFIKEWYQAPVYTPTGLIKGREMWENIITEDAVESVPYPFESLNYSTYGQRLSELVLITADTGVGKTQFLKEIEYALLTKTDYGVGFLHLEEPNKHTALGLLSVHNSKPYHLPDTPRDVRELREAFDAVLNNDRVVIWDHFGSNNIHEVLAKIRHMHNLGCKFIFLDHLSIVVSDQSGDERKQLDEISTKLKMMCVELNIHVCAVIHQNRNGLIRASAGPEQLANIVIKLTRNKEDPDPWRRNVTQVSVQKNRFCGRTGPATMLFYNEVTGRLTELTKEEIQAYNNGVEPHGGI